MTQPSLETLCANAVIRTALAVDADDMDAFEAEFTEDCVISLGDKRVAGRATIMAAMRQRSPSRVTRHLLSQIRVVADGEGEARATAYLTLYDGDRSEGDLPLRLREPALVGEYRDRLRLVEGNWRIAERQIISVFARKEN